MAGKLINDIKYVCLMNNNSFKSKSLEDNIYFTLRDIFWNGNVEECMTSNHFNRLLTNNIAFEERNNNFNYSNILYDYKSNFTRHLYNWIYSITKVELTYNRLFEFLKPEKDEEIDMSEYIKYDDWWDQLLDLRKKLKEHLEKYNKCVVEEGLLAKSAF